MERFPPTSLACIFSFLDGRSALNCSVVCHRWAKTLEEQIEVTLRLVLLQCFDVHEPTPYSVPNGRLMELLNTQRILMRKFPLTKTTRYIALQFFHSRT